MSSTETLATFDSLGLNSDLLNTVKSLGFTSPTPIQEEFIPVALTGVDCIGQARTGTGKTAAFALPVLQKLKPKSQHVQGIVLAPTRELSEQVEQEFRSLADVLHPNLVRLHELFKDEQGRWFASQLQLTIADFVDEVHNTHHPVSGMMYYEDQKETAGQAAGCFFRDRLPKYLENPAMPFHLMTLPWGSPSTSKTLRPLVAIQWERLTAIVVLPTPPLILIRLIII